MLSKWTKKKAPGGDAIAGVDLKVASASNDSHPGTSNGNGPSEVPSPTPQAANPNAVPGSPFQYAAPDGSAKTMSAVLGEIVWLMSQSQIHKSFFISDLEWFVMTPVILKQFRLFYDKEKPIGVVFWGTVSADVAARLAEGTSKLRPQDWKSGDNLWVVEVIAPFGGAEEMVKDLKAAVFPDREIRMLAVKDGKRDVRVA